MRPVAAYVTLGQKGNKPIHRAELLNESDYTIIATYQLEYRGIANYYHCAYNMGLLQSLKWTMEQSLTKTLAHKHKTTVANIYKQYKTSLTVEGKRYKVLQVTVPREGKKSLVATWGAIPLKWEIKTPVEDQPQRQQWNDRSELERRLLAQMCEQCGATRLTEIIEVHVRRFGGRDRAHRMVRELMEGSLYTPLTLPSKEGGDQSMWGRLCREKSLIF